VVERRMDTGFLGYPMLFEFGMMFGWQTQRSDSGGCGMRMRSLVFVRYTRCAASLLIRKRVSSLLCGAQKSCERDLWSHAFGLVRPQAPGSRSVQRRHPHLSRVRSAARAVRRSCDQVKREHLAFLADNHFYTKRFAFYVGQRCVSATIKAVARFGSVARIARRRAWRSSMTGWETRRAGVFAWR
jgi:hypothetical protein